ncbi:Helicase ARIP4 [Armadillidium vulgare]|nr:Helicase ARIP4 [Armadillidium vulgare]
MHVSAAYNYVGSSLYIKPLHCTVYDKAGRSCRRCVSAKLQNDSEDEQLLKPKKEIKSENEESMEDDDDSDQKSKASDDSDSDSDSDVKRKRNENDDVNNSGAHINDDFNVSDAQGRVLVNVGHPEKEEDIFLAPQLSSAVKPHQIGGIRFLYDNIVESLEQFKTSNGFGCILAHSMGLGKTLQVVSFTDIFLRHTDAKTVLIIVPINTLQNWQAEYNQWLPEERPQGIPDDMELQLREFKVFILNDAQKNLPARFKVINQWHEEGGVLLMGYELYRQLSLKKPKKPKKKKRRKNQLDDDIVDIEEEDKNKELLDEMQKALVRPGPDLALKNIRTKRRVVLTGYPLQNNLLEYWCMVDFIRPNYLGTKTEFCNMFERPIQNGQCVDSTPQDVKIMRYRAHVLHSLLEGFVQRRGHSVLAKSLPLKQEHVLLCRMTRIQRTLYSAYMAELKVNKAVANPLKAFAICCKIWNHPDVLYNFVMRRMNEDYDLDLDEVVGKQGRNKKPGKFDMMKLNENHLPFQQNQMTNWNSPNPPMSRPGVNLPPPMNMSSSVPGMGMQNAMGHQTQMPPAMMHPGMPHPGLNTHNQDNSMQHHGNPHSGMGMGPYGMGMYGMQQNYNMHQMPPHYPWGYNQGMHQQSALNLSHQANNSSMHPQNAQDIHSHQNSHTMLNQNSPGLHDQSNSNSQHRNNQNDQRDQTNQVSQSGNISPQDFTTGIPSSPANNFQKVSPENLSLNMNENSFQSSQDGMSNILNQNMKNLGLDDKPLHDTGMVDSKETLSSLLGVENNKEKAQSSQEELKLNSSSPQNTSDDKSLVKMEEESKDKDEKPGKTDELKEDKDDSDEKKEEKKDDPKKEELTFEWAENLLKDYTPGSLESSAKFQIFFKILEGTIRVGDRLLVFSQSLFTLSLLEEFLQKSFIPGSYETWSKNRTYFRLDGSTSAQEREKLINEFNNNPHVYLFLVSTRAGSLGINLVGANRVIVFDASFNPCHDTQAVCRVYRYGQQKPCHIYRLVTDNSLERRIYDRQVNKQGIADRIVDEMNPEAHLSSKEISNLLVENEEDPEPEDMNGKDERFEDEILKETIKEKGDMFTRLPFQHESLLIDRKDKKLSNAEKRLAKRSYELEKQANISYSRPSYSTFYPKNSGSQTVMMGTKIGGIVYAKPVGTVRPMQSEMGQKIEGGGTMMHRPNILSRSQTNFPVESLAKQGVSVQQITVPKDVSIPTNSGDGKPIHLKSGQSVMVIKTQKGMYLRLSDGKIIAIRTPPEEAFGMPLNQGSVTIVPTMVNNPRPRGGRGGIIPTRRGRPPMSAQYALGQVIPKGTPKGQMAVRILRKPIMSSRGGKTYQTIAVPVSGSGQGALLNKSVVITPAKAGNGQKFLKDLKISPKVQITPVPSKSKSSLSSIAGTSGLTKRLNRNNKIISAQAMAMKSEEEKRKQKDVVITRKDGGNDSSEDTSENIQDINTSTDESDVKEESSKSNDGKKEESSVSQIDNKDICSPNVDTQQSKESLMEVDMQKEAIAVEQEREQQQPIQEQQLSLTTVNNDNISGQDNVSPLDDKTSCGISVPVSEESNSQRASPASLNVIGNIGANSASNSGGSPVSEKEDILKRNANIAPPVSLENRPISLSSSEPITGIVKPLVHETLPVTPLQGLSNLVSPGEGGPGPPSTQSSFNISSMSSLSQPSTFSQSFSSSQPLFQPFLQQTLPTTSSSSITTTSGSNVAHVAPQVQSSAANMTSQSSFLSSSITSFTSAPPIHSPMHSLQSLAAPPSGTLSFPSINDSSPLTQSQHTTPNISAAVSSTTPSSSSLPSTTLSSSTSTSQANEGPLSLSNLLPSQNYSQPSTEDILPHHSSALDYLNYSLSASTSAFRRPDFPSSLPTDIQNLLNPPPPTSSQLPTSTLASTQPTTSASASSPGSFTAQSPAYSQYSSSYRRQIGFKT